MLDERPPGAHDGVVEKQIRARIGSLGQAGSDGMDQLEKLRGVVQGVVFSDRCFQDRALFAGNYLQQRLRVDAAGRKRCEVRVTDEV